CRRGAPSWRPLGALGGGQYRSSCRRSLQRWPRPGTVVSGRRGLLWSSTVEATTGGQGHRLCPLPSCSQEVQLYCEFGRPSAPGRALRLGFFKEDPLRVAVVLDRLGSGLVRLVQRGERNVRLSVELVAASLFDAVTGAPRPGRDRDGIRRSGLPHGLA